MEINTRESCLAGHCLKSVLHTGLLVALCGTFIITLSDVVKCRAGHSGTSRQGYRSGYCLDAFVRPPGIIITGENYQVENQTADTCAT